MKLYHRDVYFPDILKNFPTTKLKIDYFSPHSLEEHTKEENKFGVRFLIPSEVEIASNNIIEVALEGNEVMKLVIRNTLTDELDLVLVICKDKRKGVVLKTLWLNKKEDTHKTLDKSVYETQ